ncbi:VOC family protein [Cytobacillus purgationiresistens]|uniref:Catechol 2,3-dioxygenase-like lactoylglutathione lyase family enzyme n=1 Tax=Cytobacillus purgationiresistens TaxID=863449 RepID=A0ABU0AJL7_9BACI|nr:VOC family protein [Cytobacillus purgationiresistens]MDQ0271464.1 catechol 2,3-dioxygenase-like lactoylglutathione lyase family enzyme [Cytobacillus purgationiresistens]
MSVLFRVELYVKNIEDSLAFYKDIIGLELYGRNERCLRFNYDCFSLLLTSDEVLKKDHYFNKQLSTSMKGSGFEFIIVVESIEAVYERCMNHRYPIIDEIETYSWDMRGFKVADPDGYFIRVTSG